MRPFDEDLRNRGGPQAEARDELESKLCVDLMTMERSIAPMLAQKLFITSSSRSQKSSDFQVQTTRSRLYRNEIQKLKAHVASCSISQKSTQLLMYNFQNSVMSLDVKCSLWGGEFSAPKSENSPLLRNVAIFFPSFSLSFFH